LRALRYTLGSKENPEALTATIQQMAIDTIAVFQHSCLIPVSCAVRAMFEKALMKTAAPLAHFGLRGSIGDCDVLIEDQPQEGTPAIQSFYRIDLVEMHLTIARTVALLRLPISWNRLAEVGEMRTLTEILATMVSELSVSEIFVLPYPLEPGINAAHDRVLRGIGFSVFAEEFKKTKQGLGMSKAGGSQWKIVRPPLMRD
jgi:hypothetical protein